MKFKRIKKLTPKIYLDLTPLIDCVFLRLIFLMIITELTQVDFEHMTLPKADMAVVDKHAKKRLIINIIKQDPNNENVRKGAYRIKGEDYTPQTLIPRLKAAADEDRNTTTGSIQGSNFFRSEKRILIRCDKRVYYKAFERIMMLCAAPNHGIFIYRIEIAIAKDE